jgi:hypothetical protein
MWQGIVVQPKGIVKVVNNSLIEDAIVAIDNNTANIVNTSVPADIEISGSVFNCNRTAVRNAFFESTNSSYYSSSYFSIDGSVFTCRCGISQPAGVAPLIIYSGNGTAANPTINDYYSAANYTSAYLKAPYLGQPAYEGVHLEDIGPLPGTTNVLPIGRTNLTLFDNLTYGINAINASFSVTTSAFQRPNLQGTGILNIPTIGGYGINTSNPIPRYLNALYVRNSQFIGMIRGINSIDYEKFVIINNTFFSKQTVPGTATSITPLPGSYGMYIKTPRFGAANLSNNTIVNINNGIDFVIDANTIYTGGVGQSVGPITIATNTLSGQFANTVSPANPYIGNGIIVDNVIVPPNSNAPLGVTGSSISVNNNVISNAFRGILIRNQQYQEVRDEYNTITLQAEPNALFNNVTTQYGIEHNLVLYNHGGITYGDDIYLNTVTGFTSSFSNQTAFEAKKGIWSNMTGNHYVTCNNVTNTGRGFEFAGMHINTFWQQNQMNTCGESFALINNGIIGQQGSSSGAIDNLWNSSGLYDTYTDVNSNPLTSVLYVQANTLPYGPINNQSALNGSPYGYFNGLNEPNPPSTYACTVPPAFIDSGNGGGEITGRVAHITNNTNNARIAEATQSMLEKIVQDSIFYPTYVAENTFINKNNAYRMIANDSTLLDSSAILTNFYNSNANSAWALYCTIDSSLFAQNFAYVSSLLNAYSPACAIEQNYKRFYQIYVQGVTDTLTSADSTDLETLASSCPMLNGAVVFQARAFHNNLFNDFKHYEDNCPTANGNVRVANKQNVTESKTPVMAIYPNPTTGKVYVSGFNVNEKTTIIEITDLTGKVVYRQQSNIGNGVAELHLNLVNGVYFVHVVNTSGTTQIQKIVITN